MYDDSVPLSDRNSTVILSLIIHESSSNDSRLAGGGSLGQGYLALGLHQWHLLAVLLALQERMKTPAQYFLRK